ncbi:hypothetical protein RRG08_010385 [Elysia crispata]|uniref:Uncharacterized protein n=1 Tax=Elysia crispata TaxID=231223 RepID=A0AAE1BA75_9GAST|nr:hypothetical protein RRG08_010385 [Elysia crispata]
MSGICSGEAAPPHAVMFGTRQDTSRKRICVESTQTMLAGAQQGEAITGSVISHGAFVTQRLGSNPRYLCISCYVLTRMSYQPVV